MELQKLPVLQRLLTKFEMRQVEAFASILRILGPLLEVLQANEHRFDQLTSIRLHRVIDNKQLQLQAQDLWIALNYQLIHRLDVLPVTCWHTPGAEHAKLMDFDQMHNLLSRNRKLFVRIKQSAKAWTTGPSGGLTGGCGLGKNNVQPARHNGYRYIISVDSLYAHPIISQSELIGHNTRFIINFER